MQLNISLIEREYSKSEVEWMMQEIDSLTDEKLTLKVSEVAEKERILPKGTPFPGPWDNSKTPYLIEPMDSISEQSPVEVDVWLKGHQLGYTAAVENAIIYIIKHAPGPILYTTATGELGKEWSENRFDPMIQQCGMQNLIFSQSGRKNNKKTGDKTLLKEFPGGRIRIAGYGGTGAFRSSSYRYFFGDEIDEASADLKKQGNAIEQAEGRTSAFKAKRKIILFSTPVEKDLSNVYKAYLLGDQRKYFVPCPHCGFMQELKFEHLKYERGKNGVLDVDSVKYECQSPSCDEFFYNYHKAEMYSSNRCEWRPTTEPKRSNYVSRQMSCLYSPPGMITWSDVVQKYIDAVDSGDPGKMKTFETLYLGWPYQEKGEAPSIQNVISHRSNYPSKTVPDPVLFLTLAGDVQGDRIEIEVLGHGRKYKTWSIEYIVISGSTETNVSEAWQKFREMFLDGRFVYSNSRGSFAPSMAFIDSNYRTDIVVGFCETVQGLYPIIGQDKFSNPQQKFRINLLPGSNLMSVRIATNYFKDLVYNSLRTQKDPGLSTPINYPEFPYDYPDSYFKMLNAEYKRGVRKGNRIEYEYYCPHGKRNEALDVRVYNLAAREVLYDNVMKEVLAESIEAYEQQVKRKILVSEKVEFFYGYMEKTACFKNSC
jgi:phage terminase large subunit GpA-like protein